MIDKKKEILDKIKADWQKRGYFEKTIAAFCDMDHQVCTGIVEDIITPKEGGTFTKFYGCSYLFKGDPRDKEVNGMSLSKAMISILPREILFQSFVLKLAFLSLFVFARNKLYKYLFIYFKTLKRHSPSIPYERYNILVRELKRSMDRALVWELNRVGADTDIRKLYGDKCENLPCGIIANLSEFVYFFIEKDHAYRFPLQDVLENVDKEALKKGFIKELNRLLKIPVARTWPREPVEFRKKNSLVRKFKYLRIMILTGIVLIPPFRRILKDFLSDLNIEKVKLDEADWYFCLKRQIYDYKGKTLDERIAEKKKIDIEKDHILLEFVKRDAKEVLKQKNEKTNRG